jgi:hypothetical protein
VAAVAAYLTIPLLIPVRNRGLVKAFTSENNNELIREYSPLL